MLPQQVDAPEAEENDAAAEPVETDDSDFSPSPEGPNPAAFPFPLPHPVALPAQIRLAGLLSAAFDHEHDFTQAIFYAQLAANLQAGSSTSPRPAPAPAPNKRVADLQAAERLQRRNALRLPLIHTDLDQANQVRPRLTPATLARTEAP